AAGREHARVAGDARVARVDPAAPGAGVPAVDRVVVLHARVGASPRGVGDLIPQLAGLQRLAHLSVGPPGQLPVAVVFDGFEEAVGDAHGVVGILPADGVVSFAVE